MQLAVVSGTVFGLAEDVAFHATEQLLKAGITAEYRQRWDLKSLVEADPQAVLFVTSTTGMGEIPPMLQKLVSELEEHFPAWAGRPAAVIALGDSGYGDTFCAAGEQLRELMEELGMIELQEMLRLDASETVTQVQDSEGWVEQFAEALQAWNAA